MSIGNPTPTERRIALMPIDALAAEIDRLFAERDAARESLKTANANHEHFEREWYLRGDEIDRLRAELDAARRMLEVIRNQCDSAQRGYGDHELRPKFCELRDRIDAALREDEFDVSRRAIGLRSGSV